MINPWVIDHRRYISETIYIRGFLFIFCVIFIYGSVPSYRFDDHGGLSAAKEAKEGSEQRVSLLLRSISVFFIFRFLVCCFKIILGVKYDTFYDFKVYWYLSVEKI